MLLGNSRPRANEYVDDSIDNSIIQIMNDRIAALELDGNKK